MSPLDNLEINTGFLLIQCIIAIIFIAWPGLAIWALVVIRRQSLSGLALLGWFLAVIFIPLAGAVTALIYFAPNRVKKKTF